jgi:S-adenosylmethionine hydrolase
VTQPLVTLLTDFGLEDGYVAAMKGVLATQAPDARVVDICHQIPPQDVRRGGFVWASAVPFFPPGTIHVAVVDPGVGSRRRILAAEAGGSLYLVPDNGILGLVLKRKEVRRVVCVGRGANFLEPLSSTFHGRDIFAPAAAYLARGGELQGLGNAVRRYAWLSAVRPSRRSLPGGRLRVKGEVLYVDRFGNALTNLVLDPSVALEELHCGELSFTSLAVTYASVPKGRPLVLVNSAGHLEVALRDGSVAERYGIEVGAPVVALWRR